MEEFLEMMSYFAVFGFLGSLVPIAIYVLQSLGLYTLAKRRGIPHAWLAWIPVGHMWILGSLADDYRLKAKGVVKNRRKLLVILTAVVVVLALVLCGTTLVTALDLIEDRIDLDTQDYSYYEYAEKREKMEEEALEMLASVVLLALAMAVLSIVVMIFQYICLYELYASCDPANKTLYLLLSIFVSGLSAIFIFLCRDKDRGMYPPAPCGWQYQQPQYQQPQYQQPQYQQPQYQQPQYQPPQYQPPQYQPPRQDAESQP